MKLSQALSWGVHSLESAGLQDAYVDVLAFMSRALIQNKSYVYSHLSDEISVPVLHEFSSMVKKRAHKYPFAYITGQKEFMSLNFFVNKNTLIPRPETEILVEEILRLFPEMDNSSYLGLDIGTGCGNIALSIAKYNENFEIYAADISKGAIETALKNRKRLNLEQKVSFINCDLWTYFKNKKWENKMDFLTSNPPYVKSGQLNVRGMDLSYEPKEALDGGADGLSFYKPLAEAGGFLLKKGGYLVVEIAQGQKEAVRNIIQNKKVFENITIKKDYSGIDRIVIARRK